MNINICLDNAMRLAPDHTCIIFEEQYISYSDLCHKVNQMAHALLTLGCGRGSRIGCLTRNRPECIIIFYAAARIGAVFTPFDYQESPANLIHMIQTVAPELLFVDNSCINSCIAIQHSLNCVSHFISISKRHASYLYFPDLLIEGNGDYVCADTADQDPVAILFTSGSVSSRKAVVFSHRNFFHHVLYTNSASHAFDGGVSILSIPIYHILGFQAMTTPFYYCRTLVVMEQFEPRAWLGLVAKNSVNHVLLSPPNLTELLQCPQFEPDLLASVTDIQYGGDSSSPSMILDVIARFPSHIRFRNLYGTTETAFDVAALESQDHTLEGFEEEKSKKITRLQSVGQAMRQVTVIVADQLEQEVPRGTVGEILIHSERRMLGYLSPLTHKLIPYHQYYFHSDDIGYMDEEGYIFLLGQNVHNLANRENNRSPLLAGDFTVYPCQSSQKYMDEMDPAPLAGPLPMDMQFKAASFFQQLYTKTSISGLTDYYLKRIVQLIPDSVFGIHILSSELASISPVNSESPLKWEMPYFDTLPVHAVSSNITASETLALEDISQNCCSLQEYLESIRPAHLICTPLFDAKRQLLGILSFGRLLSGKNYGPQEQALIRIVAGYVCVAVANALEHDSLKNQNDLLGTALALTNTAVLVCSQNGTTLYQNESMGQLLSSADGRELKELLFDSIQKNISLILDTHAPSLTRRMRSTLNHHSCLYHIQTAIADFYPPTFVSVISKNTEIPDFSHLKGLLSARELEILSLIALGLSNPEIAGRIHISTNTVKYHIKNIYLKLEVSSRAELLARAYALGL